MLLLYYINSQYYYLIIFQQTSTLLQGELAVVLLSDIQFYAIKLIKKKFK